jgi:aerobic-type carbon monoxide dehydrogenase small subunit (CoxS/CutS family)
MKLACTVNGDSIEADVEPRMLLADFLRHHLRLTGTHVGCEMGVCGACTVMLDGEPVRACLTFAVQADGSELITVEGLAENGALAPLQQAFKRHHALQCGFCTPGILMTLTAVRAAGGWPRNEDEARELLSGSICRCTGYQPIVDVILENPQ